MPEGDSDGDGVPDLQDWCPDTASGVPVDKNGCALPLFQLSTRSETCIGKSNGILKVVAPEAGAYSLELAGEVTNFGQELQLENLAPGTHEVCIQAVGDANSRQCFSFVIEAGQDFKAESFVNGNTLSVKVRQGSAPYKASINGKPAGTFHSSDFELAVKHGDLLEISSALVCEGKLELAVSLENIPQLRRNPVEVTAEVLLPYEFSGPVAVKIYNASGQLLETQHLRPENALNLNINTLSLPPGIYYLQLQLEKVYGLKMIKR